MTAVQSAPAADIANLSVNLFTKSAALRPVDGVSYRVERGETLAIVGESGSGKTVMNFAPLDLMPVGVTVETTGSVKIDGVDFATISPAGRRRLRGKSVGVIFQDPMSALNPARRIGRQIAEVTELHLGLSTQQAEKRAQELLQLVGMSDPAQRLKQYPHQLSGGLRQRVMIAIAIAAEPTLLIADEPTTALDVTIQAQILRLLQDIQSRLGMGIVLITHDMGVVASVAQRVAVMYAGRIVEMGAVEDVLTAPQHPYSRGLIEAIPRDDAPPGTPFRGIPGVPPIMGAPLHSCAFADRCSLALPICRVERPPLLAVPGHAVRAACPVTLGVWS